MLKKLFEENMGNTVEIVSPSGHTVRGKVEAAFEEYVTLTTTEQHKHQVVYVHIFRVHVLPGG